MGINNFEVLKRLFLSLKMFNDDELNGLLSKSKLFWINFDRQCLIVSLLNYVELELNWKCFIFNRMIFILVQIILNNQKMKVVF